MMKRKHYLISLFMCIWAAPFLGPQKNEFIHLTSFFYTGWDDVFIAIFMGVIIGGMLRIQSINDFIDKITIWNPFNGVFLGVIGLGFIVIGLVGALIVYIRFETIELIRLPLHASVVGLSAYTIYLTSHWGKPSNS